MLDTTAPPEADWDLSQLYGGLDDPQIGIDQRSITKRVQAYAGMVRAMVDDLSRPDVMLVVLEGLAALQREELYVEARHDEELYFGCKPEYYAALYASRWPTNAEARALEGRIREWAAGLRESLDFVFVAIGRVPMAG